MTGHFVVGVEHSHLQWQLWSVRRHQGRDHRCKARGGRVKFYCLVKLEGTAPCPPKAEVAAVRTSIRVLLQPLPGIGAAYIITK